MAASASPADTALTALEQQVGELVSLCERLIEANQLLLKNCDELQQQQATLRRKNREARDAVEQIVSELKPLGMSE